MQLSILAVEGHQECQRKSRNLVTHPTHKPSHKPSHAIRLQTLACETSKARFRS
jgi:hypothetical protein